MNPFLKELHLTMDICRPCEDEEGWRLREEELKIDKLGETWEGMEEVNKTFLVMVVPHQRGYLFVLGRLTNDKVPLQRQLGVQRQALAYLMGEKIRLGFG